MSNGVPLRRSLLEGLAAIDVNDLAGAVRRGDREGHATVEVLAAGAPVKAELLQADTDLFAGPDLLDRQLEAQRAIGVADPKAVDGLAHRDAAGFPGIRGPRWFP